MRQKPIDINDAIERAAIMEFDGGMARKDAEDYTARLYGYARWEDLMKEGDDE